MAKTLFNLGKIGATPAAIEAMTAAGVHPLTLLRRHVTGDWGDIHEDDRQENQLSVEQGYRVLSAYQVGAAVVWVITEADRSSTTFLLPDEY